MPLLSNVGRRRAKLPKRLMEIAFLDWGGSGPVALLHHANGFCAATWGLFAEHLRRDYRVIAFDARGHGESTAPPAGDAYAWIEFVHDLIALVEELADERSGEPIALGIGNSFGGLVTAYAAALRPELFLKVAMLDPVILPPAELLPEILARQPQADTRAFFSKGTPMAAAARRRRQIWPSREAARQAWAGKQMFERWAPEALDLYVQEGLRDRGDGQVELCCPAEVEASVYEANRTLDLFEVAERIEAPALLLRAADGRFPLVVYQALAARIPVATVVELDVDHLMPMHDPPELADTVLEFARPGSSR
jgi:pimeloyl-ACP methyl ester carboxylesterase